MANEAKVFSEGVGGPDSPLNVRTFTIADGNAIAEGTLLVYDTASRTVIAHTAAGGLKCRPLGFATSSKVANDGHTTIGVQMSGVVTTGDLVCASQVTANRVESFAKSGSVSFYTDVTRIMGRALTTSADAGTVKVALTLG